MLKLRYIRTIPFPLHFLYSKNTKIHIRIVTQLTYFWPRVWSFSWSPQTCGFGRESELVFQTVLLTEKSKWGRWRWLRDVCLSVWSRSDPVLPYGEDGTNERPDTPPTSLIGDQKSGRADWYGGDSCSKKIPALMPTYRDSPAEVVVLLETFYILIT